MAPHDSDDVAGQTATDALEPRPNQTGLTMNRKRHQAIGRELSRTFAMILAEPIPQTLLDCLTQDRI
jgi:hypothetical protein